MGVLGLLVCGCTTLLGIDKDYHPPDGGAGGTSTGGTGGTSTSGAGGTSTGGTGGTSSGGSCGDGKVSDAEQCDEGASTATCDADCTLPACGDGFLNAAAGEMCDDGNASDADGCSAACTEQKVLSVAAGNQSTCVLLSNGVVKCWGWNSYGDLGLGDTMNRGDQPGEMGAALPPVDLGEGAKPIAITAGFYHTCALLSDGTVKCWGLNNFGQLGLGDTASRGDNPGEVGGMSPVVQLGSGVTAVAITAGNEHTCALLSDGNVKCWGHNDQGQLGLGDVADRGDEPGEMGDALPAVDLGLGVTATAVTAGTSDSCAVLAGGTMKCWGFNNYGQLGLGDTVNRGDGAGEMGAALPAVSLGSGATVSSVEASGYHVCAVLSTGALKCWGYNALGQLGLGDIQDRGDQPGEMGDALPAVLIGAGTTAIAVAGGVGYTCALRSDARVRCWGTDNSGQLGGSQPVDLGAGLAATAVTANEFHVCAIADARVKCWGLNSSGDLGLGDTDNRGDQQAEMGDALPFVKLFNDQW